MLWLMLSGLCTRALPSCMCINNSVIVCAPLSRIHTHPLSFSFTPIFVLDCVLSLSSVLFLPDLPLTCVCTHSLLRALSLPRSLFPHSLSFSLTHTRTHALILPCFSLAHSPTHSFSFTHTHMHIRALSSVLPSRTLFLSHIVPKNWGLLLLNTQDMVGRNCSRKFQIFAAAR